MNTAFVGINSGAADRASERRPDRRRHLGARLGSAHDRRHAETAIRAGRSGVPSVGGEQCSIERLCGGNSKRIGEAATSALTGLAACISRVIEVSNKIFIVGPSVTAEERQINDRRRRFLRQSTARRGRPLWPIYGSLIDPNPDRSSGRSQRQQPRRGRRGRQHRQDGRRRELWMRSRVEAWIGCRFQDHRRARVIVPSFEEISARIPRLEPSAIAVQARTNDRRSRRGQCASLSGRSGIGCRLLTAMWDSRPFDHRIADRPGLPSAL